MIQDIAHRIDDASVAAVVGADLRRPLLAAAAVLAMPVMTIDARHIDAFAASAERPRGAARGRWLVLVENCHEAERTGDLPEDAARTGEDLVLDLAFDGHPALPDDRCVVMLFDEPTDLSDALHDDECPCEVISREQAAPDDAAGDETTAGADADAPAPAPLAMAA